MRTRGTSFSRGFTLLELILVLVLITVIAGIVVPSLGRFEQTQRMNASTEEVVALARWARTEAITRGVSFRLNFDPVQRMYWLTMQNGPALGNQMQNGQTSFLTPGQNQNSTQFAAVGEEAGRQFVAGEGVTFICSMLQQPDGLYLEFRPSGRCDQGTITFTDTAARTIEVGSLSATELFHVLTDEERQAELAQQLPPPPAQSR